MPNEELVSKAMHHGGATGQIALAEFILKSYENELSPLLTTFLNKVAQDGYKVIAENTGLPSEDIALQVSDMLKFVH